MPMGPPKTSGSWWRGLTECGPLEKGMANCREPVRHSTRDKGHEEGRSAYAKAGSSLRSLPGYSRASTPQKNQSLPTLLLCALTSDFTGGCPPPPYRSLCQRVNLQLQIIKFLVIFPLTPAESQPGARNPPRLLIMPGLLRPTREGV